MSKIEFMDYDTFHKMTGGSLEDYIEFLKKNPMVVDPSIQIKKDTKEQSKNKTK